MRFCETVVSPAVEILVACEVFVVTVFPFESRIEVESVTDLLADESFRTLVFTLTVADPLDTDGVVTNVPQYATCTGSSTVSHTFRKIPLPEYQREDG
jgi:hypothetical protein